MAGDARRFENWEFPYALVLGLGEAARYALAVGTEGYARARQLAGILRERLAALPGVRVLDRGRERCAIVTLAMDGRNAADVKQALRAQGINTSSAHRTNPSRLPSRPATTARSWKAAWTSASEVPRASATIAPSTEPRGTAPASASA